MPDFADEVQHLLVLAETDPDRAIAKFDVLVALHGRAALAAALATVAPSEIAELRP